MAEEHDREKPPASLQLERGREEEKEEEVVAAVARHNTSFVDMPSMTCSLPPTSPPADGSFILSLTKLTDH